MCQLVTTLFGSSTKLSETYSADHHKSPFNNNASRCVYCGKGITLDLSSTVHLVPRLFPNFKTILCTILKNVISAVIAVTEHAKK